MKNLLLIIASAAALSTPVMAYENTTSDSGIYVGGNYGYLKIESQEDFDDDADGLQGLIGFRFNNYVALEGSYLDFGDYGKNAAKASTDGYTVAFKGILPVHDRFEIHLKLGQLWWETDYKVLGVGGSADDEALFLGAGVSFGITDNLFLNAGYVAYDLELDVDNIDDQDEDTNFDSDLEHVTLGIEYRFSM